MSNRLADETSPYLRQHAENPVDWFPWGDEAFEKAAAEDKPVFLSVGYSACHWCHVMERESFESEEVAAFLNEHFVSVKVDREERPDVDAVYMDAVQALTGGGGWPMSVFLRPDRRPFYGGTYWPHPPRPGMPGFLHILTRLNHVWRAERENANTAAEGLTDAVRQAAEAPPSGDGEPGADLLETAGRKLLRYADREQGGFGRAPKFPHAVDLRVLLRIGRRFGEPEATEHVTNTLDLMVRGGIYDQLGGGFHRYSTDGQWLVPHFEKMLYDQGLLVPALLEASLADGGDAGARKNARRAARETCNYVLREMTVDGGAFAAAQDADTDGEEGKFFVWDRSEFDAALGESLGAFFAAGFGVTEGGNWEGKNILTAPRDPETPPIDAEPLELEDALAALLERRNTTRTRPFRDDKVVASWNGLMIGALGQAAAVLEEPKYADAALAAADFLQAELWHDGTLHRSWKDGRRGAPGFAEDYFALADGLCDLWQARQEPRLLSFATELAEAGLDRFGGPTPESPLFQTAEGEDELPARRIEATDGATPGGTALAITALQKLAALTGRREWDDRATALLGGLSGVMKAQPMQAGWALLGLDRRLGPRTEVVIAAESEQAAAPLLAAARQTFAPHATLVNAAADTGGVDPELLTGKIPQDGRAAAYVCVGTSCSPPITEPAALRGRLLPQGAAG
ncbi:thioredoxin domain-containing protein [Alienimonas sp. DA493]|uniref:thioredoxin domain-containing protein n=1 Tax=Alienimonas sp. DA493 TaxID=3373605 RepID=UPI00375488FB